MIKKFLTVLVLGLAVFAVSCAKDKELTTSNVTDAATAAGSIDLSFVVFADDTNTEAIAAIKSAVNADEDVKGENMAADSVVIYKGIFANSTALGSATANEAVITAGDYTAVITLGGASGYTLPSGMTEGANVIYSTFTATAKPTEITLGSVSVLAVDGEDDILEAFTLSTSLNAITVKKGSGDGSSAYDLSDTTATTGDLDVIEGVITTAIETALALSDTDNSDDLDQVNVTVELTAADSSATTTTAKITLEAKTGYMFTGGSNPIVIDNITVTAGSFDNDSTND